MIEISVTCQAEKERRLLYEELMPQFISIMEGESSLIANMANISALIKEFFGFLWVGFYLVDNDRNDLVLGPFQGSAACTRIGYGRGVCGSAWKEEKSMVVRNVEEFPGHIACSSLSKSEIVVPLRDRSGQIIGVLDIDSDKPADFDDVDREFLEILAERICKTAN